METQTDAEYATKVSGRYNAPRRHSAHGLPPAGTSNRDAMSGLGKCNCSSLRPVPIFFLVPHIHKQWSPATSAQQEMVARKLGRCFSGLSRCDGGPTRPLLVSSCPAAMRASGPSRVLNADANCTRTLLTFFVHRAWPRQGLPRTWRVHVRRKSTAGDRMPSVIDCVRAAMLGGWVRHRLDDRDLLCFEDV